MSDNAPIQSSNATPDGSKVDQSNSLLRYYSKGDTDPSLFSASDRNEEIQVLRRIQNLQVDRYDAEPEPDGTYTTYAKVIQSGEKLVIELYDIPSGTGDGTGNMFYTGEYVAADSYDVGDVVRVSPSNPNSTTGTGAKTTVPGVYICILAVTESGTPPVHPLQAGGENTSWNWLATWPTLKNDCDENGNPVVDFVDSQPQPS